MGPKSGRIVPIGRGGTDLQDQLREVCKIGIALSHERDLKRLLDKILFEARRFTRAEAGSLYVAEKGQLFFKCVQNDAVPSGSVAAVATPTRAAPGIPIARTSIAGYVASTGEVLNIRDVYTLAPGVEYAFDESFDRRSGFRSRSMLVAPMRSPEGDVIGVIQLINARDESGVVCPFPASMEELVLALASQAAVALENANLAQELRRAYEETIFRLARAAEYRDTDTGQHIRRMSHYACEIARVIGFAEEQLRDLLLATPMHDIGKIAVADAILQKPGKLTPEEYREMQKHTVYGGAILADSDVPILQLSQTIALTHHEKWDGSGYPRGLKGEEIPLVGRITAISDVFDALTSKRCYKDPIPLHQACEILKSSAGSHFDPAVVDAFFRVYERILEIRERYA